VDKIKLPDLISKRFREIVVIPRMSKDVDHLLLIHHFLGQAGNPLHPDFHNYVKGEINHSP